MKVIVFVAVSSILFASNAAGDWITKSKPDLKNFRVERIDFDVTNGPRTLKIETDVELGDGYHSKHIDVHFDGDVSDGDRASDDGEYDDFYIGLKGTKYYISKACTRWNNYDEGYEKALNKPGEKNVWEYSISGEELIIRLNDKKIGTNKCNDKIKKYNEEKRKYNKKKGRKLNKGVIPEFTQIKQIWFTPSPQEATQRYKIVKDKE